MKPSIPQEDQERIDEMVSTYRRSLENLYRMAYLKGQMDQVEADRDALRAEHARVSQ